MKIIKRSMLTVSLLLMSTSLVNASDEMQKSVIKLKNQSTIYTTLTTKSGLRLQGGEEGLKVIDNKVFNLPIFKSELNLRVYALVEQVDGKIIVGGNFDDINGYKIKDIVRLNTDGSVDEEFMSESNGFNGEVYSIEVLENGSILVGGYFTELNDNEISKGLIMLNVDGSINVEYKDLNNYKVSIVNDIKVVKDDIFIAGTFIKDENSSEAILSIDKYGNLKSEFNEKVNKVQGEAFKIAIKKDSLIIVGDLSMEGNNLLSDIIKIDINGNVDKDFTIPALDGFMFNVQYKNDTLLIGGELIVDSNESIIETNVAQYKNQELTPLTSSINSIYTINVTKEIK